MFIKIKGVLINLDNVFSIKIIFGENIDETYEDFIESDKWYVWISGPSITSQEFIECINEKEALELVTEIEKLLISNKTFNADCMI
jgi:hypothetical protein